MRRGRHHTQKHITPGTDGFAFFRKPLSNLSLVEALNKQILPDEKPVGCDELLPWTLWYVHFKVTAANSFKESSLTAQAKIRDLQKFISYFYHNTDGQTQRWTPAFTDLFLDRLQHDHYHAASVRRVFATLASFAKYLQSAGVYNDETFPLSASPHLPVLPSAEPIYLKVVEQRGRGEKEVAKSNEVFEMLLAAAHKRIGHAPNSRLRPYRDIAIVVTLWHSALRVTEICSLNIFQYKYDDEAKSSFFENVKCKGNKERDVVVAEQACKSIDAYFAEERGNKEGPLFQSWHGRRLTRSGIWQILQNIARDASTGIDVRILFNPHRFRHDRAHILLKGGMSESHIAAELGHSSTQYMDRYTKRNRAERVIEINKATKKAKEI